MMAIGAGVAGIAVGWLLRGALDRAILVIVTRTLTSPVGKKHVAEKMTETIDKLRSDKDAG